MLSGDPLALCKSCLDRINGFSERILGIFHLFCLYVALGLSRQKETMDENRASILKSVEQKFLSVYL